MANLRHCSGERSLVGVEFPVRLGDERLHGIESLLHACNHLLKLILRDSSVSHDEKSGIAVHVEFLGSARGDAPKSIQRDRAGLCPSRQARLGTVGTAHLGQSTLVVRYTSVTSAAGSRLARDQANQAAGVVDLSTGEAEGVHFLVLDLSTPSTTYHQLKRTRHSDNGQSTTSETKVS
ncbi:hypothetical protein TKK_0017264 [Trichogramma kaykai]